MARDRKGKQKRKWKARRKRPAYTTVPRSPADASLPEASLFSDLVALEKMVDRALTSRRREIEHAHREIEREVRTLRIHVSNSHSGQEELMGVSRNSKTTTRFLRQLQAPGAPDPPSWTLRVQGELTMLIGQLTGPRFSDFFRRIVVEVDKDKVGVGFSTGGWVRVD